MTHFLRKAEVRPFRIDRPRASVMARYANNEIVVPNEVLVVRDAVEQHVPNIHVCKADTLWNDLPERIKVFSEDRQRLRGKHMVTVESFNPWHMLAEKP